MQIEQPLNSENFHIPKPRKALNIAFLKVKPSRSQIVWFKVHLIELLDRANVAVSEEFQKNLVIDFLKQTWYLPNYSPKVAEKSSRLKNFERTNDSLGVS